MHSRMGVEFADDQRCSPGMQKQVAGEFVGD